jgi:hypothetical protein
LRGKEVISCEGDGCFMHYDMLRDYSIMWDGVESYSCSFDVNVICS